MSDSLTAQKALTPFYGDSAELGLTGASLVNALPCPAVLVWPDGSIIAANENAKDIVVKGIGGALNLRSDLLSQVQTIAKTKTSENWIIRIKKSGQPGLAAMSYSLTGISIPVAGKKTPAVLIYGADSGLERNLRQALIESRVFYQDLANCSSDFTWSTDTHGVFTFINQKGIAGYHADIVHGKFAIELLAPCTTRSQAEDVFQTRAPVTEKEIWFRGVDGEDFCYMISALPVRDKDGVWTGVRGVGRDVTELRAREAELERARRSEKLINTVLGIIRNEVAHSKMMATAAAAVIDAIGMTSCWIFQRKKGDEFTSKTANILNIVPRASLAMEGKPTSTELRKIVEKKLNSTGSNASVYSENGWSFLVAKTEFGSKTNGALCFVRQITEDTQAAEKKPIWDPFEHSLISSVASQLSVIVAQSEYQENLKILSQTDGLTGLMNRRSFIPEVTRRLAHHDRQNRKAAFLYIDLDNFKGINDNDGHARGDQILCAVSELLKLSCRVSDLSARFGGDEFVVWLEEADESIAILKANDLIDGCQDIIAIAKEAPGHHASPGRRGEMSFEHLGMSIGIAVFAPGSKESIDQLICRADHALNIAKKGGKGGYRVAKPATPSTIDQPNQKDVGT